MTEPVLVSSVDEYLKAILPYQQKAFAQIHRFGSVRPAILFRGQKDRVDLVAKIAKIVEEKKILRPISFERNRLRCVRSEMVGSDRYTDWDLVALSQHYGIETRFLDWTSNSFVALWFAVSKSDEHREFDNRDAVVWILETSERDFKIPEDELSPIPKEKGSETVIFAPDLIDCRILMQDSYMMRQVYEYTNPCDKKEFRIRPVDKNLTFKNRVHCAVKILGDFRSNIVEELGKYGYTKESLLPNSAYSIAKKRCEDLINEYAGNK